MKIVRKSIVQERENVFDIEVEGNHNFFTSCGLVHNCHHFSAATFSEAVPKFNARYKFGLTATPSRKDGTERIFFNTLGDIFYQAEDEKHDVGIRKIRTGFSFHSRTGFVPSDERMVTIMCRNADRNRMILDEIMAACEKERKCLVLSDRLDHLDILATKLNERLKEKGLFRSVDFYVGGRKPEELVIAGNADIIMATYQMSSEALDLPKLETLYLASPKGDVIQSVGRLLRKADDKKRPIVVDFIDESCPLSMRRWKHREEYYVGQGWIK